MISKIEYWEAIRILKLAMSQLQPDGRSCAICGDTGHQAWECSYNPLVMAKRGYEFEEYWRCFHCDEVFTNYKKAEEHFGDIGSSKPQCCV